MPPVPSSEPISYCPSRVPGVRAMSGGIITLERPKGYTQTRHALSDSNRPLSTPSTHGLNCNQVSAANDHGVVEVVHGSADVAWNQKKKLADRRNCAAGSHAHWEVFFTGGERLEFRMAKDDAGR